MKLELQTDKHQDPPETLKRVPTWAWAGTRKQMAFDLCDGSTLCGFQSQIRCLAKEFECSEAKLPEHGTRTRRLN